MDYLSNIGFQVFKHPSKLVRRGSARVQDRNKQGKKLFFYEMFTFFLLFDLFVWFEKIEPESLQIFNHILIVTFSEYGFTNLSITSSVFFLHNFSSIQLFFSLSGSWGCVMQ